MLGLGLTIVFKHGSGTDIQHGVGTDIKHGIRTENTGLSQCETGTDSQLSWVGGDCIVEDLHIT